MDDPLRPRSKHRRSLSASSSAGLAGGNGGAAGGGKERAWVGVRIRPLLEQEQLAHERVAWRQTGPGSLQHVDPDKPAAQCLAYSAARVFGEAAGGAQVYGEAAARLVAGALAGRSGALLAYGQTGSGKTHTVQELLQAAAADLFGQVAASSGREHVVRLCALEVYNEVVRDLLRDSSPALRLADDPLHGVVAEGLTQAGVGSLRQLLQLLAEVEARRQTRATRMNDNSSRSHQIVQLYVESRAAPGGRGGAGGDDGGGDAAQPPDSTRQGPSGAGGLAKGAVAASENGGGSATPAITAATLSFVDLAGSEREVQAAEAAGSDRERARQKEASSINKSLLTLNSVIRALADNAAKRHIPFRDSKLTRLLQPCLSGNGHLSIITTISPAAGSADNTRAALQFATAAGRVVVRPQVAHVAASRAAISGVVAEADQLRAQLADKDVAEGEREALRSRLQQLQQQILRGDPEASKLRESLDCQSPQWQNRVALARELRASSMGVRASWAPGEAPVASSSGGDGGTRPGTSAGVRDSTAGLGGALGAGVGLQSLLARDGGGGDGSGSPMRRSMRLLDCYLPRGGGGSGGSSGGGGGDGDSSANTSGAWQQRQRPKQLRPSQHAAQQGRPAGSASILQQAAAAAQQQAPQQQDSVVAADTNGSPTKQQQHQHQQQAAKAGVQNQQQHTGSRLNPANSRPTEEAQRTMQTQKLQEPCGPEAEAAMAGLEVEARCYKHVQEYTLAELAAALEHLECQQATGQGLGSWSSDQLEALRSEVARKRAAEALTQLGDRALDALTRKVHSYTSSSADGSPYGELRRQLADSATRDGSGSGGGESSVLETPAAAAALASAAAAGMAHHAASSRGTSGGGGSRSSGGGSAADWRPARSDASPELPPGSHEDDGGSWPRLMPGRTSPTPPGRHASARDGPAGAAPSGDPAAPPSLSPERSASSAGGSAACAGQAAASPPAPDAAVAPTQEQLARMQEAWRESVEKDVSCLREVLAQYKEQVERLEMQKKLLLSQVLKLEFSLEEEEGHAEELQERLQHAVRERDAARAAVAPAGAAAGAAAAAAADSPAAAAGAGAGAAAPGGPAGNLPAINTSPPLLSHLSIFDACSDDGWASTPTADSLLSKIVALWEELYVPLAYRSRFFLSFRGREVFYYEVEARRLEWKRSQMLAGATEEASGWAEAQPQQQQQQQQQHLARGSYGGASAAGGELPATPTCRGGSTTPRPFASASAAAALTASSSFGGVRRRSRQLDKAARALDWERKSLAAGLKWSLTEAEREELYRAWGVDPDTKERKLQLVFKLWSKETLQQPDGMARSSELVVLLSGTDASEHMMELVFGSTLREYGAAGSAAGRGNGGGLGFAVSSIVRRLAPPVGRAPGSPLRSSMSVGGGAAGGGGGFGGGYGPPGRTGSFTSRIQSGFMSLLSSRDRPPGGLTSQQLAGLGGGGGGGVQSREGSFSSMASSMAHFRRR